MLIGAVIPVMKKRAPGNGRMKEKESIMKRIKRFSAYIIGFIMLFLMLCAPAALAKSKSGSNSLSFWMDLLADSGFVPEDDGDDPDDIEVDEKETYTSKDEVAAYIHEFGHLPSNFITKKKAKSLGWVSSEGNLGKVAPGKSIGGDHFGNYEGQLPEVKGRDYYECDIDSTGGYRGAKRIIYSDDGWIYYTEDHYETFELLYEGD